MNSEDNAFRSGFVALVGEPNVGKSTLLNRLIGQKVAIVSPKAQTTRHRIMGILNKDKLQIVFTDTPGFCAKSNALTQTMRRIAGHAAADADLTILLIALRKDLELSEHEQILAEEAKRNDGKLIVVLNKIDKLKAKHDLLPWINLVQEAFAPDEILPISGMNGDGVDFLLEAVEKRLPVSEPLFPTDIHTDQAERLLCAEFIREQLLLGLDQEVPHGAAVVIDEFDDVRDNEKKPMCRLHGRIIVERDSQKGIVVGKGGAKIKSISSKARAGIEEMLGAPVFLRLQVVVDKNWTQSKAALRRYGLDA